MSNQRALLASIAFAAVAAFVALPLASRATAEEGGMEKEKQPAAAPVAPAFKLKDLDGKDRTLEEFKGKWVVLEWVNLGCPFVKKFYEPGYMQGLQKTYTEKGVVWLSICSSASGKQGYMTPEEWKKAVAEKKIASTAILLDADGTVGKAYGAKTTPQMWIVCPNGTIRYTGAIDSDPSAKGDPTKATNYVSAALDAFLADKEPATRETPSYGCSVKYAN